MEIGKETYISSEDKKENYLNLNLNLLSEKSDWKEAIGIFNNRLNKRFIFPAKELLEKDGNTYGFAAMAIICLLIETLYQFSAGVDQTPSKKNEEKYSMFLVKILDGDIKEKVARSFYRNIRCGILHSAQTKNNTSLNCDKEKVITLTGKRMSVNVKKLLESVERYFEKYKTDLLDENNTALREAFIKKMDFICDK